MITHKFNCFFENAELLYTEFDIIPLMYGSVGLEYLTKTDLNSDDIDILIPKKFVTSKWGSFKVFLEDKGYTLTNEHEHTFIKDGIYYSYADIENLKEFADIELEDISCFCEQNTKFLLLSLEQYLKVYTKSSKDGYRINVKEKQDCEKIEFIKSIKCCTQFSPNLSKKSLVFCTR